MEAQSSSGSRRKISIVLVRPKLDENVGAVARAMKNFALEDLVLVAPQCDYLSARSRRRSCHADDLLERAVCHAELATALAPFTLVVGTTARLGKYCRPVYSPAAVAERVLALPGDARVALVFGREDFGLDREDRRQCHLLSRIPVNAAFSSLNLSQAVLLYSYELYKQLHGAPEPQLRQELATHAELEGMYRHLETSLLRAGFFVGDHPDHLMEYFRRLFGRVQMNRREVRIIRGLMHLLDKLVGGERK